MCFIIGYGKYVKNFYIIRGEGYMIIIFEDVGKVCGKVCIIVSFSRIWYLSRGERFRMCVINICC